jgi:predicted ATPase
MIDKIIFSGYKSFKNKSELELKPLTVIFGKNSSGKSAVAKLPTLIENSLSGKYIEPLSYINKRIELGAEYRDLFYNRELQQQLNIQIFSGKNFLNVEITNSINKPIITSWESFFEDDLSKNEKLTSKQIDEAQQVLFSGFIKNDVREELKDVFKLKTDYIGPFRLTPPRVFFLKGKEGYKRIGIKGENAYQVLAINEELKTKVSNWYEDNFDGWELFVNKIEPYYEIRIKRKNSKNNGVNIVDVGQGMSQALPLIVKAHMISAKPILNIWEQPELHLHPAAHGNLAELLVNSIKNSKNRYLVETHSKNFILRLRRLIAEEKLDKNLVNLYWVDYSELESSSSLNKVPIKDNGEVDSWPENIFNESFEETLALKKAQNIHK